MSIFVGSSEVSQIFVGSTEVKEVYQGSNLVFSNSIQFVGYRSFASSSAGPHSLTGLTGGIASAPATGDLVIVAVTNDNTTNRDMTISSSGWTTVADLYVSDNADTNLGVSTKIMGSPADTSFTMTSGHSNEYIVYVLRNTATPNPFDAASVTRTKTNTGVPDPNAITTTTDKSVVVVVGAAAAIFSSLATFTAPSGYSNFYEQGDSSNRIGVGMKEISPAGAEDPAAFGGGSNNTNNSYCAVTMAIRKA